MTPEVQVLLSTYNGEVYIEEQIRSILNQKDVQVSLLIRDDGSSDSTVSIIEGIHDPRIHVIREENVGSTKSFMKLIRLAGKSAFYAFSDQDDVWDEEKLITAVSSIGDYPVPAIYSSAARLVDSALQPLGTVNCRAKTDLGSAIVKNYVTGCTCVMNHALMELLKAGTPESIPYHDWWANLVALSAGGVSVYDEVPHVSYRQHGHNVVGASENPLVKWRRRLERFKSSRYERDHMAEELLRLYDDRISPDARDLLEEVRDYRSHKVRVITDRRLSTGSSVDNLLFDILVLLNKA